MNEDPWDRVKRSLDEMSVRLASAVTEEQFQSVGHVAREVLISLAQAVFERDRHLGPQDETPSRTDAKRMLDAVVAYELKGQSREVMRKYIKAVLDLANELQHKRTATHREAALCTEATGSAVKSIALLLGENIADLALPGVTSERDLIRALNEFAAEEGRLRQHPGAGSMVLWLGGYESPEERARLEQGREHNRLLSDWKKRVRELLASRAEEFVADWDEVNEYDAAALLRTIIQELRRRL
jgi:hypothetical protein